LEVSEKRLLRQFSQAKNKTTVYHSDTAFVAKEKVIEHGSIPHYRAALREYLAVQRGEYFADEYFVGKMLVLDVVEKEKELFVVCS
jgi:hypothetical protein